MPVPTGAVFEGQPAGGLAVWDVAHLLPTDPKRPYTSRDPENINRIFMHHSGADGQPGYLGALNSASFVTRAKDKGGRGWPGAAYHYWLPTEPDRDSSDRIVIYKMNDDETRCWHTGGPANTFGIGVALQGNLGRHPPTDAQIEMMEGMLPYLLDRHRLFLPDGLSWHSDSARFGGTGKLTCPGDWLTNYLRHYRDGMPQA